MEGKGISIIESLSHINRVEISENLEHKVFLSIGKAMLIHARMKGIALGFIFVSSCVLFVPTFGHLVNEINASGIGQYLQILVSDSSYAITFWKEIGLVIIETAPVIALTSLLLVILIMLSSLKGAVKMLTLKKQSNLFI